MYPRMPVSTMGCVFQKRHILDGMLHMTRRALHLRSPFCSSEFGNRVASVDSDDVDAHLSPPLGTEHCCMKLISNDRVHICEISFRLWLGKPPPRGVFNSTRYKIS